MDEPLVALHGFAGTGRSWAAAAPGARAPDLPGHGTASALRPIGFDGCVRAVLAAAPERFALAGYSMGARIALHVALAAPRRVVRLALVSATAGIEDARERAARRAADAQLAAWMQGATIEQIADRWLAQPLFAGDPPRARAAQREDVLRNEPAGLAAALLGIGTGSMAPLWERLGELEMPCVVLAGARDERYVALAARIAGALGGDARVVVVPGAGHGLPREAPGAVARALGLRAPQK